MRIAILTSANQWFVPYAEALQKKIKDSELFFNHTKITKPFDILFILSYHKIIEKKFLHHKYNVVIHASALPHGKGWAPMFWQIMEGKNKIPFSMFEASDGVDDGKIYMQNVLHLSGYELHDELRQKQAEFTNMMCLKFLDIPKESKPQAGKESFYPKRFPTDSCLNIHKSINEQFNLLRICSNSEYPAFFEKNGHRYILKIQEAPDE